MEGCQVVWHRLLTTGVAGMYRVCVVVVGGGGAEGVCVGGGTDPRA